MGCFSKTALEFLARPVMLAGSVDGGFDRGHLRGEHSAGAPCSPEDEGAADEGVHQSLPLLDDDDELSDEDDDPLS